MIRQPTLIRDRVLARVIDMLEHLRIQVSMLAETEYDVLKVIERPQQYDIAVDLSNYLMARLGHTAAPSEPRFDKTRRALAKKRGRPPRGLKTAGEPTDADAKV